MRDTTENTTETQHTAASLDVDGFRDASRRRRGRFAPLRAPATVRPATLLATVGLAALLAASCGFGGNSRDSLDRASQESAAAAAAAASTTTTTRGPGAGIEVRMARANWSSSYFQAAILLALLEELEYTVSDPAAAELTPAEVYPMIATGEFDFWGHGWFPSHSQYLVVEHPDGDLPDGDLVGDHLSDVGRLIPGGGLQGIMVDKVSADTHGVTSMADIAANPEPWDHDGNGLADIAGCDDGWSCKSVIANAITLNGWDDSIEQISTDWFGLWAEGQARLERGEPMMTYMWTPTAHIITLTPGRNGYWLSFPVAAEDQDIAAPVPEAQCPGQPCLMGFAPADIRVVANNDFLAANPAAAKIFELFTIDVLDIALQNLSYEEGENTEADIARHAAEWIADNRDRVAIWMATARAIAG